MIEMLTSPASVYLIHRSHTKQQLFHPLRERRAANPTNQTVLKRPVSICFTIKNLTPNNKEQIYSLQASQTTVTAAASEV